VDVRIVRVTFADWVAGDVLLLGLKVAKVADAMFVVARVPDFAGRLLPRGMGVAAFDELNRLARGFGGCDENVDMIWHDNETVEEKFTCVAIAQESGNEKFRVYRSLEVTMLLMS
jgi:hypothetical protein